MVALEIGSVWVEQSEDGLWHWKIAYNRDPTEEERAGVHAVLDCISAMSEAEQEGPLH